MQWFRQPLEPLLSVVMREPGAVFEHDVAPPCSNRILVPFALDRQRGTGVTAGTEIRFEKCAFVLHT
jgi:hypothetical protein